MSVHLDALADEVFDAASAVGRGDGVSIRLPFGEVRRNPAYPDLFFLNGISGLRAPDWTIRDVEQAVVAHLAGIRIVRITSRDPDTIARLGPQLLDAGYEAECRVAMVHVASREVARAAAVATSLVEAAADWQAFEQSIRYDAAEHHWRDGMARQLVELYRAQGANPSQSWLLARAAGEVLGHVGLYQHATVGYLHALFVRGAARRRGIGSALVAEAGRRARAIGCARLTLQCTRDSFLPVYYHALGFRSVGEIWIWTKARQP
ncbi:MAG: GNAT family N-acetyltransferase [Candidatus Dormibacteraeota bacterium]|nr:GNAT family N-acetyltransferase [Candidatus Dormibacteraeota bacterium]